MRRAFLSGVVATLLVGAIAAAVVIGSGVIDVAARKRPLLDRALAYASTRSIAHHAGQEPNPLARDAAAAKRGLEHYRDDCLACHGAPGVDPAEFAAGLHPPPPNLASRAVQSAFTDGMFYRAIAGGIGSTGMPAFGPPSHSPDEIWSIVAFLRHLPALTPAEKQALGRREAGEEQRAAPAGEASPRGQGGAAATTAPAGPGQRVHQVSISGFQFAPNTITVHVGDIVEWKNDDIAAHTATANDHSFDTGRIDVGQTRRLAMTRAGRFPYFCRYHLTMKATLVVE